MDHYRITNGPPLNCKSLSYLPRILEYALPKTNVNEDSFQTLQSREGVVFYPEDVMDVLQRKDGEILLSCQCERCKTSRHTSKVENESRINSVFDARDPSKLLLIILIYLGRADLIHELVKGGVKDACLRDAPKVLQKGEANLERLFSAPNTQTIKQFCDKYDEALDIFQPVTFKLGSQYIEYNRTKRFPFLDDQHHALGSFAEVRKFDILPEYLAKEIVEAKWYKELSKVSIY